MKVRGESIGSAPQVSIFARLMPYGIALLMLFLSFLPFGVDDSMLTLGPQFVLCVVYYWAVRAPKLLPPAMVFLLGLAIDLISAGPLGFWGLIYLAAYAIVSIWPRRFAARGFLRDWLGFAIITAVATALEWAFGSLYFGLLIPVLPLALGGLVALALYGPLAKLFDVLCKPREQATLVIKRGL